LYRVARHRELGQPAKCIGFLIGTFVNPGVRESVHPSYEWLMERAGIGSRSTTSKAINQLVESGMLVVWRNQRMANHYSLPFDGREKWKPKSL